MSKLKGVGRGLVKGFLELPNPPKNVFASCIDPDNDEAVELRDVASHNPSVTLVKLDVRSDADIANAVTTVQRVLGQRGLNLLINYAAINSQLHGLESLTRADIMSHCDCNVAGPLLVSQAMLPLLRKASKQNETQPLGCNRAAIVNMSTGLVKSKFSLPGERRFSYVLTKAAAAIATVMMSRELSPDGILVAGMCPGWVKTDMG
ncbi:C-factor-like isoform X2 [Haliotis rufescens]|uniref:C-factor-like isoform X2 n=1 Tax=Haliotis rufescens TaxID=6454 RepID=UPI00201F1939|nr:C-factor-like isoform X2 [Haliotis rufescens]